jgi:hypothetical protein
MKEFLRRADRFVCMLKEILPKIDDQNAVKIDDQKHFK